MNKCCISLNLNNVNPLTIDHDILKIRHRTCVNVEYLNPEFVTLLKTVNLRVGYLESFYSLPYFTLPIHVDDLGGDYTKINFIYGGSGSLMHWYKVKENIIVPPNSMAVDLATPNKLNAPRPSYIPYTPDQVELIESNPLIYPSLIQAGCPHNVTNRDEPRLCITTILTDLTTYKRLTMAEAQPRLSKFMIN